MTIKQRLKDGDTVIGGWCFSGSPVMAECLALAPFDFVVLDLEHGAIGPEAVENCITRIQKQGKEAFVRVASFSRMPFARIRQSLDSGATGIICANVQSDLEAANFKRCCQYDGGRSYSLARCTDYGTNFTDYTNNADDAITVVGMIESRSGVENIHGICSAGLDAIMIGPYDLSASVGTPGSFLSDPYMDALREIKSVCSEHGMPMGMHCPHAMHQSVVTAKSMIETGYRFICAGMDTTTLIQASNGILEGVR